MRPRLYLDLYQCSSCEQQSVTMGHGTRPAKRKRCQHCVATGPVRWAPFTNRHTFHLVIGHNGKPEYRDLVH